ncbi:hypothetical protein [Altererythrobacter sp. ZODW24]|uniref:hypothetical protein n=1 Tax=Altererythrobacter sp. ZODW24 TaxID=2185142 RepID=UPI000DF72FA4|nr:hypothetical protein [Altererythrobacter sp. ZODW24]
MRPFVALLLAALAALGFTSPSFAQASAAGEYRVPGSLEMFLGLRLNEDGTYQFALSVGALDKRSSGTWEQDGQQVTLTTTPKPVPPEFERAANDEAADAPFIMVAWPNGNGVPGVDIVLGCGEDTVLRDYTQYDGWSPPEGACATPEWVELTEGIHEIKSPRFDISGETGALRFTLVPNSFGVLDMTGTTGVLEGEALSLSFMGSTENFVRVRLTD